jgi:TPR repeat protein
MSLRFKPRNILFSIAAIMLLTCAGDAFSFDQESYYYDKAMKGNVEARYRLGIEYYSRYNKRDQAREWLEKAAMQRHVEAQYALGINYAFERPVDIDMAKYWLEKAAKQRHPQAETYLHYFQAMNQAPPKIDPKVTRANKIKELTKKAESNDPDTQYQLGMEYMRDANQNAELNARVWLEKAAKQGHIEAQYWLGMSYGWHNPNNIKEAIHWLKEAANQDHLDAKTYLGYLQSLSFAGAADAK